MRPMRQDVRDTIPPVAATPVVFHVPSVMRSLTGGASEVRALSGTVGQALTQLQERYPALVRAIRTEAGEIRPHVNVFVNQQDIRQRQGLDTVLTSDDEVIILPSISGG